MGPTISEALPEATLRELGLWLLRRRLRLRVTGDSMVPTLNAGDLILVDPDAYGTREPNPGDIVVAQHPYRTDLVIVKRVVTLTPEKRLILHSDNPQSGSDSRQFGSIALHHMIGRVTCRVG